MPLPTSVKSQGSSRSNLERARQQSNALREARVSTRAAARAITEAQAEKNAEQDLNQRPSGTSPSTAATKPSSGAVQPASSQRRYTLATAEHPRRAMSDDQSDHPLHGRNATGEARSELVWETRITDLQGAVDRIRNEVVNELEVVGRNGRDVTRKIDKMEAEFVEINGGFADMIRMMYTLEDSVQSSNRKVQEVLERLGTLETVVSKGTRFTSAQQEEPPAAPIVPPSPLPFPVMLAEDVAPKEEGPVGAASHQSSISHIAENNLRNLPSIRAAGQNAAHINRPQVATQEDLVTEAATPAPLPSHYQPEVVPQRLGSYAPGLEPKTTMVDAFASLVDYRTYRLANTSATLTAKESRYLHHVKR